MFHFDFSTELTMTQLYKLVCERIRVCEKFRPPLPAVCREASFPYCHALSSSAAPAHRTRDVDSTFLPDLGAEVGQVILLPYAMARAPYEQHITDGRRATCHREQHDALCGARHC